MQPSPMNLSDLRPGLARFSQEILDPRGYKHSVGAILGLFPQVRLQHFPHFCHDGGPIHVYGKLSDR